MQIEDFISFYLVGGTALALRLGHRKSIDIDLFTHTNFDAFELASVIERDLNAQNIETGKNLLRCFISNIKVELISHQYSLLKPIENINSLRVASLEDLSAFKLNALVNRGAKKDFWDIATLLEHLTLNQILEYYSLKYKNHNIWMVEKSLCYFNDADEENTEIVSFTNETWQNIKQKIRVSTIAYFKNL